MASFQFLCFLSLILIQFSLHINAQPSYISSICQGGNFTNGTKFQSNLNLLLSSLSSNVTAVNNGFSNRTIGSNRDQVNGLFLCKGDIPTTVCENCVKIATKEIPRRCPNKKEAVVWYDDCMLRYSNRSIFSVMEESPGVFLKNENNVSDPNLFTPILAILMQGLVSNATDMRNSSKFSTGEINFNSSQKIYGLAQCTPDLTSIDCIKCLETGISNFPKCCDGKQGARVLLPSCNVRYELYAFYQMETDAPSPSPSLPPTTPPLSANPSPSPSLPPTTPPLSANPTPTTPPPSANPTPTNEKGKNSCNIVLTMLIPFVIALVLTGDAMITQGRIPATFSQMQSDMPTVDHNPPRSDESNKSTSNSSKHYYWSVNELTITEMYSQ